MTLRIFCAAFLFLGAAAARQPVEGLIALTRFGPRFEVVSEFLIAEGASVVPLRVPQGKVLTLRHVTATCTLGSGISAMNFWTIRTSVDHTIHHYLPIRVAGRSDWSVWVASEKVLVSARAGARPVATFQRSSIFGLLNDACVGSWAGYFDDAPEERPRQ